MLSSNDWARISKAVRAQEAMSVEQTREWDGTTIRVETAVAPEPWTAPMIVGIWVDRPGRYRCHQWCASVELARKNLEEWIK